MDPTEGSYGWAPDDPRWNDAQAGGQGRLEPPPPPVPSFADADTAVGAMPPVPRGPHEAPGEPPPAAPPPDGPPPGPWSTPAPWTPPAPWTGQSGSEYPAPPDTRPAPRSQPPSPFTLHPQFSDPTTRSGYGLGVPPGLPAPGGRGPSPERPPSGLAVPDPARGMLLYRRAQPRNRRDDEFRRAGRAELFSDDARYGVLFALTTAWYGPLAVLLLIWVLTVGAGDGPVGPRVLGGLAWLATAAALSLGVVGLLRWARVGWRALTLSIAAALIGGGVATIAHTLSG